MEILATLIPLKPNLSEMVNFSLMGFTVVMFVLFVLSGVTAIIGVFFKLADKIANAPKKPATVTQGGATSSKPAPTDRDFAIAAAVASALPSLADDSETIAILTAAAYAVIGEPCVVLSYRDSVPDFSYARQGRQEIFESHVIVPTRVK